MKTICHMRICALYVIITATLNTAGAKTKTIGVSQAQNTQTHSTTAPDPIKNTHSWQDICKNSKNAIVQIFSYSSVFDFFEPFKAPEQQMGVGTGFFINENGEILTAFHVVEQSTALFIQIPAIGKQRFAVEFVGACPDRDIAKLKLTPNALGTIKQALNITQLPYLTLGDSDSLEEGQEIMALGFPLGQENLKAAIGTVSGRESTYKGECIQTTAPVNPGNSGGPFLNENGNVIGVCVFGIREDNKTNIEGVSYLTPVNNITIVIDQLNNKQIVHDISLGITVKPTTEQTLTHLGCPRDGGVYISDVIKNSLTDSMGIQKGDILYKINDKKIDRYGFVDAPWSTRKITCPDYIDRLPRNSALTMTIYRHGSPICYSGVMTNQAKEKITYIHPWFEKLPDYEVIGGLVVTQMTINHIEILQKAQVDTSYIDKYIDKENQLKPRVLITQIYPGSPFHEARCFGNGDLVIKRVNNTKIYTVQDFRDAVLAHPESDALTLETTGGSFAAIPIQDIIDQNDTLAETYFYPETELVAALAVQHIKL